jgi:hypothetical protein
MGASPSSGAGVYSIRVDADFWDRSVSIENAVLMQDIHVLLPQVILSDAALKSLAAHLQGWLGNRQPFECSISPEGAGDQVVSVMVCRDEELICSEDRPALVLSYSRGSAMRGRWAFVVDQSCIRSFLEDLQELHSGTAG